jgi:hypothetical protein
MCEDPELACIDDGTTALIGSPTPGPVDGVSVASWSTADKIAGAIRRSLHHMPAEAAAKICGLLSPTTLAILAGTLALWAGSHAIGIGEAIDVLVLVTGFVFVGWEALRAVKHLIAFARLSVGAQTEADLESAGDHLAKAVAIIGVDVVLAVLTHRSIKAWQGRYQPKITGDPLMAEGAGATTKFGDITYSTAGSEDEQALVLLHEKVHSFLSPKLQVLREWRADVGQAGYDNSQLLRYLEEALAETYAQLRVNGLKGLPVGFKFPFKSGAYNLTVTGVIVEAGVYLGTIAAGGLTFYVYLERTR